MCESLYQLLSENVHIFLFNFAKGSIVDSTKDDGRLAICTILYGGNLYGCYGMLENTQMCEVIQTW